MSFKCLVCDFDGTVADTFEQAVRIYNELALEHGFRRVEGADIERVRGMTLAQFLRFSRVPKRRLPGLLLAGRSKLAREAREIPPVHGMAEVLGIARRQMTRIGVLTSNSEHNVRTFAETRGIDIFDFVSSVPKLSGKAKYLRAIMMTFSLNPDEILFIGDELRDIKAGRKARVPVGAVTWGFNSRELLLNSNPDYVIESPSQLLEILCPDL